MTTSIVPRDRPEHNDVRDIVEDLAAGDPARHVARTMPDRGGRPAVHHDASWTRISDDILAACGGGF